MRVAERIVEQIRNSINIVDLISEHIMLKKRGRNYIGLCPFHGEKTPSFTVSDDKQIYHCFGCHKGGNVFSFVMEYEKITYYEAILELAKRAGIDLEFDKDDGKKNELEELFDINVIAAKFFLNNLLNTPEGETAKKYFDNRKLTLKTLREFGLGYSPNKRDALTNHFVENKVNLDKAQTLGLIYKNNSGSFNDRFWGRIMFPIFSPTGRVTAFAGRIMHNDGGNVAKYVNSPESPIYYKSKVLYGLSFSKDAIRTQDQVILVEGYMDYLSLYQHGVKNIVAISGTALTEDQATMLARYTRNAVLLFDSDSAGIKASLRSIEILLKKDIDISIASLPTGEDPDSYIQKFGKEEFLKQVDSAKNFLEYQTTYYQKLGMFNDPVKMTEAIRELVKPLVFINDALKRSLLLRSIANKFNLREVLLENELLKLLNGQKITDQKSEVKQAEISKTVETKAAIQKENFLEKDLLKVLLDGDQDIIDFIFRYIVPEDIYSPLNNTLINILYEKHMHHEEISASKLIEEIYDEQLKTYMMQLIFERNALLSKESDLDDVYEKGNISLTFAKDIIFNIKTSHIKTEIQQNLALYSKCDTDEKKNDISNHIRFLREEIKNLEKELRYKKENF